MKIGIPKEIADSENRVASIPDSAGRLVKAGNDVLVQSGAGLQASFTDEAYAAAGATIVPDAATLYAQSDMVLKVQKPQMNEALGKHEVALMRPGTTLVSFLQPLTSPELVSMLAQAGVTSFAMESIPRITRAQSMDALSSMSTVAGYKAVLLAAVASGKFFPMFMTAAGTVPPAKVFVLGAGVAGLQAIATARRLGAVVEAFDVRPAVKEQVQSLGAKFVEMEITENTETSGGYAKELSEETHRREVELLHKHAKQSDVFITTALIPGRPAPELITEEMVVDMQPGSVIVDLAAENGGNCKLTEAGAEVIRYNVRILGPLNLPSTMPIHASQMYSKNVFNLLGLLVKDGQLTLNFDDEIVAGTCITHGGNIVNPAAKAVVDAAPAKEGVRA
ncbi:MAG: Re/Si-specific NAD(P)(+) transhydrogenase subunit alpha [Chloroflexia bacterium]